MSRFSLYTLRMTALVMVSFIFSACYGWEVSEETMAQETISRADTLLHHLPSRLNRAIRKMEQARKIPPRQRVDLIHGLLQQAHRKVDVFTSLQRTLEELLIHSDNLRVRTRGNVERLSVRMSSYRRVALEKIDELERELMRTENEVQRAVRGELEYSLNEYRTKSKKDELPYDPVDSLVNALATEERPSFARESRGVRSRAAGMTESFDTYEYEQRDPFASDTHAAPPRPRSSASGISIVSAVSKELASDIRWVLFKVLSVCSWVKRSLVGVACTISDSLSSLVTWYLRKQDPYEHTAGVKERHLVRAWAIYKLSSWWVKTNNSIKRTATEAGMIVRTMYRDMGCLVTCSGQAVGAAGNGIMRFVSRVCTVVTKIPYALLDGAHAMHYVWERLTSALSDVVRQIGFVIWQRVYTSSAALARGVYTGSRTLCRKTASLGTAAAHAAQQVTVSTGRRIGSVCKGMYDGAGKAAQATTRGIVHTGRVTGTCGEALASRIKAGSTMVLHVGATGLKKVWGTSLTLSKKSMALCLNIGRTFVAATKKVFDYFASALGACMRGMRAGASYGVGTAQKGARTLQNGACQLGTAAAQGSEKIGRAAWCGVKKLGSLTSQGATTVSQAAKNGTRHVGAAAHRGAEKVCAGAYTVRCIAVWCGYKVISGARMIWRKMRSVFAVFVAHSKRVCGRITATLQTGWSGVRSGAVHSKKTAQQGVKKIQAGARSLGVAATDGAKKVGSTTVHGVTKLCSAANHGAQQLSTAVTTGAKKVREGVHTAGSVTVDRTQQLIRGVRKVMTTLSTALIQNVAAVWQYIGAMLDTGWHAMRTGVACGVAKAKYGTCALQEAVQHCGKASLERFNKACVATGRGAQVMGSCVRSGMKKVGEVAFEGAKNISSAAARGASAVSTTATHNAHRLSEATKNGVCTLGAQVRAGSDITVQRVQRLASGVYGLSVALVKKVYAMLTSVVIWVRTKMYHGAMATNASVRFTCAAVGHCAATTSNMVIDGSRRLGDAVINSVHTVGHAAAHNSRAAARAAVRGLRNVAAQGQHVAGRVKATVGTGWGGMRAGVARGAAAAGRGLQKVQAGVRHLGSGAKQGAQKVGLVAQQGAEKACSFAKEGVQCAGTAATRSGKYLGSLAAQGAHTMSDGVRSLGNTAVAWVKATLLAALVTAGEWSNAVKEKVVTVLHRVREGIAGGYVSVKGRVQQWWTPKYVVPNAVSKDEVQRAAQQHNVSSQGVSITDPENIVQTTAPSPIKHTQNRIIAFVQYVVLTCRGLMSRAWRSVKNVWFNMLDTVLRGSERITCTVKGSVGSIGDAVHKTATRCYHAGKKVVTGGVGAAQQGAQQGMRLFGNAVDAARTHAVSGASAVADTAQGMLTKGVAAAKSGWHTVKNTVWKQKERLPWTDSTPRGAKTTSPIKMAAHLPVSSAKHSTQI